MAITWQEHDYMVMVGVGAEEQGKNMARAWGQHGKSMAITWQ
jgi:hypothetical protein